MNPTVPSNGPRGHEQDDPQGTGGTSPHPPLMVTTGWPGFLWAVGAFLFVAMVVHVAALLITGGPVSGPVSLRKPAAFAETGWLTAWSAALILPTLHMRAWQRHLIGSAVILFGVGEPRSSGSRHGVAFPATTTSPPRWTPR